MLNMIRVVPIVNATKKNSYRTWTWVTIWPEHRDIYLENLQLTSEMNAPHSPHEMTRGKWPQNGHMYFVHRSKCLTSRACVSKCIHTRARVLYILTYSCIHSMSALGHDLRPLHVRVGNPWSMATDSVTIPLTNTEIYNTEIYKTEIIIF